MVHPRVRTVNPAELLAGDTIASGPPRALFVSGICICEQPLLYDPITATTRLSLA